MIANLNLNTNVNVNVKSNNVQFESVDRFIYSFLLQIECANNTIVIMNPQFLRLLADPWIYCNGTGNKTNENTDDIHSDI